MLTALASGLQQTSSLAGITKHPACDLPMNLILLFNHWLTIATSRGQKIMFPSLHAVTFKAWCWKCMQREAAMLKNCRQLLILADTTSFLLHVSRIFPFLWLCFASVSLCHCWSSSFIHQPAIGNNGKWHEEAIKMTISSYFKNKKRKISCSSSHMPTSTCSQSPAPPSPPAHPYPHVQHSQPAVKLIASTSFQGHTITASYSQPCYMNT